MTAVVAPWLAATLTWVGHGPVRAEFLEPIEITSYEPTPTPSEGLSRQGEHQSSACGARATETVPAFHR